MKALYNPSKDEFILKIYPFKGKPNKKAGHFKLWWDNEGNIQAIAITKYIEELQQFKKNISTIHLGGLWKGTKITDEDIKKVRGELLEKLEEKW